MPLKVCYTFCLILQLIIAPRAFGQKQLVLLRNERVVKRFYPGDDFIFKLKGSKTIKRSYVNYLSDTAIVTHRDTIAFHRIDRIYFNYEMFSNRLGAKLIAAGVVLMLFDQLNVVLIQHDKPRLDPGISRVSAGFVIVGLPMVLIRKKSQKMTFKYHLLTVKKSSPFYMPDPKGFISPYIDN